MQEPAIPYIVQRLPDFFQRNEGRLESYTAFTTKLQNFIANNDFDGMAELSFDFEVFHRVYGFTKAEKRQIFVQLAHFLGQPYIYLTKNAVRQSHFPSLVWILKVTSQPLEETEVVIDWLHLFEIMEQIFLFNRNNITINLELDKVIYFKRFLSYLEVLKKFFTIDSIEKVFQRSEERLMYVGMIVLKHFLKWSHRVPSSHYWPVVQRVFQMWRLRLFQPFEETLCHIVFNVIRRHPNLPWHEYTEFLMQRFYREIILILPIQDSKYGYLTRHANISGFNKFPPMQRVIGATLANLLLPTSENNSQEVWDHVLRIFGLVRSMLHPNNQQNATQRVLQLYYFFLSQFVHRYSREQKQRKKDTLEIELDEEPTEKAETAPEGILDDDDQSSDDEPTPLSCFITPALVEKVIELYMADVGHMLYLKEYKEKSVQQIIRLLVSLNPQQLIPQIMDLIDRAFTRDDMKYSTIVGVLGVLVPFLLSKDFPQGLSYLPSILRTLGNQITAHDSTLAYAVWRIFDLVLQFVPVYDLDDLRRENPDLDSVMSLRDQQLTEEITTIVVESFRRFLSLFEFLSQKKKEQIKQLRTLFTSIQNKFYNLVAQSSKSVFEELLRITFEYMEERLHPHVQQYFAQLLSAFSQRDPKRTIETFFPIIAEKLLKSGGAPAKHLRYLEQSPYELQITHQPTLLYYLSLLEELVGFAHHHSEPFDRELTAIIQLCLQHEEIQVFNEGLRILQQLFLGLVSVHPADVSFRDEPRLDVKWAENTWRQFRKGFTVHWFTPNNEDRKYLMRLVNRYYYPILNNLLEYIVQQNKTEEDVSQYIDSNLFEIACQLNEPRCSQNMQADLTTRAELHRALQIIGEASTVLELRCRDSPQNSNPATKYQDWICFDELNDEVAKVKQLIIQLFPVIVKCGLANDNRISNAYGKLLVQRLGRQTKDEHNSQLVQVRKWVSQRISIFRNPVTKRTVMSRFLKVVLASYNLNIRMLGMQYMQSSEEEVFVKILTCLGFHEPSQKSAFSYLNQLYKTSATTNVATIEVLQRLLDGDLFSKEYLSTTDPGLLPQLGIFQKVVAQLVIRYIDYITYQPEFKVTYLYMFRSLSEAYEHLIDKTFKKQFNLILVKFLEHMFKVISRGSTYRIDQTAQFIEGVETNTNQVKPQEDGTYEFCLENLKRTVTLITSQPQNIRKNIVNGLILLFNPPLFRDGKLDYLILQGDPLRIALDLNASGEFAYRSYGRTLLYRLMRIAKQMHQSQQEFQLGQSNFVAPKPVDEYLANRYLRPEDLASTHIKNSNRLGVFTYYSTFAYNTINEEELAITMTLLRQRFGDKEYCIKMLQGILNDLQANEDNSALFHQQGFDYTNVFHDVAKFFHSQVNGNLKRENIFYKNFTITYEYIKRLFKKLFEFTGYQFYLNTCEYMLNVSSKQNDKDNQMLTRLYVFGLLKAVHSKWSIPSTLTRESIVDFALGLLDTNMNTQSREQFIQVQIGLMMVVFDSDIRVLDYLIKKLTNRLSEHTPELKIIRSVSLVSCAMKCSGFRGTSYHKGVWDQLIPLLKSTQDARVIQTVVGLFLNHVKDVIPTNKVTIKQVFSINELPNSFVDVPLTDYALPFVEEFKSVIEYLVSLLRSPQIEQRKLAFDSVSQIVESIKYDQLNSNILQYYKDLIQYIIEFKEEDIENETISQQFAAYSLGLSQTIMDEYSFQTILGMLRVAANSIFYKTRLRALKFLAHLIYNNLKCDRVQLIKEFAFLLQDDQKQVSDQAKTFVSFLVSTLLLQDQGRVADYFIENGSNPSTEVIGKTGLIGMINSLQNLTTPWSNRAVRAILHGKSKATYIKEFAAAFQKSNRANYLNNDSNHPYEIEITEKLAEYVSPYNYFA